MKEIGGIDKRGARSEIQWRPRRKYEDKALMGAVAFMLSGCVAMFRGADERFSLLCFVLGAIFAAAALICGALDRVVSELEYFRPMIRVDTALSPLSLKRRREITKALRDQPAGRMQSYNGFTSNEDPNEKEDPQQCDHGISLSRDCEECKPFRRGA